ncbi:helix-turn-helix domain-containing protein [Mycolicibacterium canariasense]|nr:helix-turn-helix transcriptional regulator [Mycolicibacterium canariasense]MCV7208077.1 helix-turn-helix domain-containing protein [Mycolicibacterium canariasense]ORV09572.1 hypothetical protein AWB94_10010 [Mycolicibacterium canariasense]
MNSAEAGTGNELGVFLRIRRGLVRPEEVGFPRGQRRVSGLRREEVAILIGVSVDYYTRLEQGRERHPSPPLLGALSRALRLSMDEHVHLHRLAGVDSAHGISRTNRSVTPALRQLLDQWSMQPAFIYNDVQDILASNALGTVLHAGFSNADNFGRMVFLDPEGKRFFAEWDRVATDTVAALRQTWGRPSERHRIQPLIDEIRCGSAEFENLWRTHTVASKSHATKLIEHPAVGRLSLDYHTFEVTGVVDQYLLVCRAEPGGRSEQALKLLGTLSATERAKGR